MNSRRTRQSLTCNNGRYRPAPSDASARTNAVILLWHCPKSAARLRRIAADIGANYAAENELNPAAQRRLHPRLRRDVVSVGCLLEWREHRPVDLNDDHHDDVAVGSSGTLTHREEHQPDGWQPLHATDHSPDTRGPRSRQPARQPPEELSARSVERKKASVDPDPPAVPELLPDDGGIR